MAKKIEKVLKVSLTKNTSVEKGGAWLLIIEDDNGLTHSAWSNPSAAKRYLKKYVLENTPRKSIKMEIRVKDMNDKPTHIVGELAYKVAA